MLHDDYKEKEKQEEVASLKRRLAKRPRGKDILRKAERQIFADDILQPYQPAFKQRWYKAWKDKQLINDAADRADIRKQQEIEEAYRKKPKGIVTIEEKILKEVKEEHPTMIDDSDIIKHSG